MKSPLESTCFGDPLRILCSATAGHHRVFQTKAVTRDPGSTNDCYKPALAPVLRLGRSMEAFRTSPSEPLPNKRIKRGLSDIATLSMIKNWARRPGLKPVLGPFIPTEADHMKGFAYFISIDT